MNYEAITVPCLWHDHVEAINLRLVPETAHPGVSSFPLEKLPRLDSRERTCLTDFSNFFKFSWDSGFVMIRL